MPPIADGMQPNLSFISILQPFLQKCLNIADTTIQVQFSFAQSDNDSCCRRHKSNAL